MPCQSSAIVLRQSSSCHHGVLTIIPTDETATGGPGVAGRAAGGPGENEMATRNSGVTSAAEEQPCAVREGLTAAKLRRHSEGANRRKGADEANSKRQCTSEGNGGEQQVALIGRLTIGKGPRRQGGMERYGGK